MKTKEDYYKELYEDKCWSLVLSELPWADAYDMMMRLHEQYPDIEIKLDKPRQTYVMAGR